MRRAGLIAALVALASPAHADEGELALHLELAPALLRVGDYAGLGHTAATAGGRAGLRLGYGLSNLLALELGAGVLYALPRLDDQPVPGRSEEIRGQERRSDLALRVTAGATARLGARFIPTVTAFTGYQHRLLLGVEYIGEGGAAIPHPEATPQKTSSELLVGLGLGLEVRINASWVIGLSVQLVHAFSTAGQHYDAVEVPLVAGRYGYPAWRGSTDPMPGGLPLGQAR